MIKNVNNTSPAFASGNVQKTSDIKQVLTDDLVKMPHDSFEGGNKEEKKSGWGKKALIAGAVLAAGAGIYKFRGKIGELFNKMRGKTAETPPRTQEQVVNDLEKVADKAAKAKENVAKEA